MFTIDFIDEVTAVQVRKLFQSLYGNDYLYQDVYNPQLLLHEIQEGRLLGVLAYDVSSAEPAGYVALAKSSTNPHLWEEKSLVVAPDYNYTNLSSVLANYFINLSICNSLEINCMFAQAVCHHYFTQVVCIKAGWLPCALSLDELDKSIFKDHKEEITRVACVMLYWEIHEQPEPVYLPIEYAEILRLLASPLKPRAFRVSNVGLPILGTTIGEKHYNRSNQTCKVMIQEIGADWTTYVTELLSEAIRRKVISLQVMLNTSCPYLGAAVTVMRHKGFFLGGLAPHYFGADGLLMQMVLGKEPDYEGIKLYSRPAKELLAFIRTDREAVQRLSLKSATFQ